MNEVLAETVDETKNKADAPNRDTSYDTEKKNGTIETTYYNYNDVLISHDKNDKIVYAISFANLDGKITNMAQYVWNESKPADLTAGTAAPKSVVLYDGEGNVVKTLTQGTNTLNYTEWNEIAGKGSIVVTPAANNEIAIDGKTTFTSKPVTLTTTIGTDETIVVLSQGDKAGAKTQSYTYTIKYAAATGDAELLEKTTGNEAVLPGTLPTDLTLQEFVSRYELSDPKSSIVWNWTTKGNTSFQTEGFTVPALAQAQTMSEIAGVTAIVTAQNGNFKAYKGGYGAVLDDEDIVTLTMHSSILVLSDPADTSATIAPTATSASYISTYVLPKGVNVYFYAYGDKSFSDGTVTIAGTYDSTSSTTISKAYVTSEDATITDVDNFFDVQIVANSGVTQVTGSDLSTPKSVANGGNVTFTITVANGYEPTTTTENVTFEKGTVGTSTTTWKVTVSNVTEDQYIGISVNNVAAAAANQAEADRRAAAINGKTINVRHTNGAGDIQDEIQSAIRSEINTPAGRYTANMADHVLPTSGQKTLENVEITVNHNGALATATVTLIVTIP